MDNPNYKSGFVALIGRPNVAQTTRNKIQGIYTSKDAQIIFIDTPGVHKPATKLGDFMERSTLSALDEVDAIVYVVSATEKRGPGDNFIIERLKQVQQPIYLVVNKIDQVHPNDLPGIVDQYKGSLPFKGSIPVSALQGNNVNELINELVAGLPNGPQYYPADQISDHPERFVIAEMIREKALRCSGRHLNSAGRCRARSHFGEHRGGTARTKGDYHWEKGTDAQENWDTGPPRY